MREAGWLRTPGEGRYARPEPERRYLLASVPAGATAPRLVEDRYIDGTTLRLRRVSDGTHAVHKLTQKVRVGAGGPDSVATTNIYLTADEHERLAALPAHEVRKTRHEWTVDGVRWAVDELGGRWRGLLLAEVDAGSAPHTPPPPLCADVTADERFTGAGLAHAGDDDVAAVLAWAAEAARRCC